MGKKNDIKKIENILEFLLSKTINSNKISININNVGISAVMDVYSSLYSYYGDYIFVEKEHGDDMSYNSSITGLCFSKETVVKKLAELKTSQENMRKWKSIVLALFLLCVFCFISFYVGLQTGKMSAKYDEIYMAFKELSTLCVDIKNNYRDRLLFIEKTMQDNNSSQKGPSSDNQSDN